MKSLFGRSLCLWFSKSQLSLSKALSSQEQICISKKWGYGSKWFRVVFANGNSLASCMTTAEFVDALAHMLGRECEHADAIDAYTQSTMDGEQHTETWIEFTSEARPASWSRLCRSIARLDVALKSIRELVSIEKNIARNISSNTMSTSFLIGHLFIYTANGNLLYLLLLTTSRCLAKTKRSS